MTLREYIEALTKSVEDTPELLDMEVIYSSDDEGNAFNRVHADADGDVISVGHYNGGYNGEFMSDPEDMEEYEVTPNAVCIN